MTAILRNLPFGKEKDEVALGLERIRIKPYQICVWVSISAPEVLEFPLHALRVPALLDTGHNHNFSIKEEHLIQWASLQLDALPGIGHIKEGRHRLALYGANVWIHRNRSGERDAVIHDTPYRLKVDQGIVVYPRGAGYPRLPLLGLRALIRNRLHFAIDPERCVVNLRTADWRTKLLRWLW